MVDLIEVFNLTPVFAEILRKQFTLSCFKPHILTKLSYNFKISTTLRRKLQERHMTQSNNSKETQIWYPTA